MAKFTKNFKNGSIINVLTFRNKDFTLTMVPRNCGMKSIEKCFEEQLKNEFSDWEEIADTYQIDIDLIGSTEYETEEILELLEEIE